MRTHGMAILVAVLVSLAASAAAEETWTYFPGDDIAIPQKVKSMAIDHDGVLWVSGGWRGLWRYDGSEWTTIWLTLDGEWITYPGEKPPPLGHVTSIVVDADNVTWFAMPHAVISFDGTAWNMYESDIDFLSAARR